MDLENGDLSEHVIVALRRIIQSVDLHSRYLSKHFGLTGPQLIILREVGQSKSLAVGEIAKSVSLSQATVTGIVERLEKRGLVLRRRCENDRRRVIVEETPACRELLNSAPPLMQVSLIDRFNKLENWEQAMILAALQRLVNLIDAGDLDVEPLLTTGPVMEVNSGL